MANFGRCRIASLLVLAILAWFTADALAQGFGRNKVNYSQLEWESIRSEHFDITFPKGAYRMAQYATETAEDALEELSSRWDYQPRNRIPVILYTSHASFSETNVIGALIGEGTGGFTEFSRNRVVIPFEGSYSQLRHVVRHELVHALQYDLFAGGSLKTLALSRLVSLPLWAVEGLAEYESIGWDVEADNVMRDAVISDYVPPIEMMQGGVFAYKGGQALYRYLHETYGVDRIGQYLRSLKETASVEKSLLAVYGIQMEDLEPKWKTWLKKEYWPEIAERLSPGEFARQLTDHSKGDGYLNVGARLSPDGRRVAFVSTRRDFADVYLMELSSGKVERIIEGEQSPDFESLYLLRPGLAWSPDGQRLAIIAKQRGRSALFIYDLEAGRIARDYPIDVDAAFTPAWSPSGDAMVFAALKDGWSDLYSMDLRSGSLVPLTHDPYDERDPEWSPDGSRIAFSSDREDHGLTFDDTPRFSHGQYDIFILDQVSKGLTRLTRHPARDLYPVWGPEGRSILFVSERSGIGNVYVQPLGSDEPTAITDALTGCQQIDLSADGSQLVFTAFQEGGFDLFLMDRPLDSRYSPKPTELARTWFGTSPSAPEQTTSETETAPVAAPQPTTSPDASTAPVPERLLSPLSASIPKDLAALGSRRSQEPVAAAQADEDDEPTDTETTDDEPQDEDAPRVSRKFARPKPYQPRLTVDGFGVYTQVSSFSGFSGQAYLSMSDLLGNERLIVVTDQSISSLRNLNAVASYVRLNRRLDYGITAFHTRDFFLASEGQSRYRTVLVADRSVGLEGMAEYPLSQFARFETGIGAQRIYRDRVGIQLTPYDRLDAFGNAIRQVDEEPIDAKSMLPVRMAFVQDTVGYGMFGPVDGRRLRLEAFAAPGFGSGYLRFGTASVDYRHYVRVGSEQSFAIRVTGGTSRGPNAQRFFLGGIASEISPRVSRAVDEALSAEELFFPSFQGPLRGTDLYESVGDTFALINLEWRFPLIDRLTLGWPLRVTFRYIGGALFADLGSAFDLRASSSPAASVDSLSDLRDRIVGGVGAGSRLNLGIFVLRFDVAWRIDTELVSRSPRYYWSVGTDF
ncbi:hypothetical protein FJZ36_12360 [Candidatus Poribacteria bacterium]|nr:hypothetical protein [Candidatus Poribacteria bacterium]